MDNFNKQKCQKGQIQVIVLGVYHMRGSESHVYNGEVDDVLAHNGDISSILPYKSLTIS